MQGGKLTFRLHPVQKAQLRWRLRNHHGAQDALFRRFVEALNVAHEECGDELVHGIVNGNVGIDFRSLGRTEEARNEQAYARSEPLPLFPS